ncbi:AlpA family transcriptional regulator [Sphingobium sp. DC-2]|uniref:helix-turn-helix transcriptional regulator n=1 Tax=Sphingobium sp. DC-2 TaxID=1303256 RepID=UPI0009DD8147|nr:AlpA family phage regulatory protein [Sphingobium sp. DC-2]
MNDASAPARTGRLLSRPEVEAETRLSRSTIYRQIEAGQFPRPIRVGIRAVAWWESDIHQWKNSRPPSDAGH